MSEPEQPIEDPLPKLIAEIDQMIATAGHTARAAKGIYDSFIEAGFTEKQALYLTACQLTGGAGDTP